MSDVIQLELDHILVTSDAGLGRLLPNAGMVGRGGRKGRPGCPTGQDDRLKRSLKRSTETID